MGQKPRHTRRKAIAAFLSAAAVPRLSSAFAQEAASPLLKRIRMATMATSDFNGAIDWYTRWLEYNATFSGTIDAATAASWGTPRMAGKPFAILTSAGSKEAVLRVVEIDPMPSFASNTTLGWGGVEIAVQDNYRLYEKFKAGPVEVIRPPSSIGVGFDSVHAMQVRGPTGETIGLTMETGDRNNSELPIPQATIDRIFITIVQTPNIHVQRDFYVDTFKVAPYRTYSLKSARRSKLLGLPEDHVYELTLVRGSMHGNIIEIGSLPPPGGPRPRPDGQLPPGNAMMSFAVPSMDGLGVKFFTPPAKVGMKAYGGARVATLVGPAGELMELVEEN